MRPGLRSFSETCCFGYDVAYGPMPVEDNDQSQAMPLNWEQGVNPPMLSTNVQGSVTGVRRIC